MTSPTQPQPPQVPAEDCRRAAAMLCHLATGYQAGYDAVGAEAAAAGRLHGLLGAVLFVVDQMFGDDLRNPKVIARLRELTAKCEGETNE